MHSENLIKNNIPKSDIELPYCQLSAKYNSDFLMGTDYPIGYERWGNKMQRVVE
jgi:hypothetical protein